ncbi:MAG: SIR2 family protein [Candidatus Marinimicrobia bacterium]|nr:SIR2 family protein [Candidatus Neomarinimicrobiota bacterium]
MTEIPPYLFQQIREGQVILFLGAGASHDAINKKGNRMPDGKKLGEILSDKFLDGKYKDATLSNIGDYAINESDLLTVQEFVRNLMVGFLPTDAHLLLPKFMWWGLITTNYDRLIEDAYHNSPGVQFPKPIIEDGDKIEELIRDLKSILLLKLHGCITRTANINCPLILSTDQYITHLVGRSRLFKRFEEWGTEKTIVFIGHSLQDMDIRILINRLNTLGNARPRYYFVAPNVTEVEQRFWETKRITTISFTFSDFMKSLETKIPKSVRVLALVRESPKLPITEKFIINNPDLSQNFLQFILNDVDYVKSVCSTEPLLPKEFYKGLNIGWSSIEQQLDVPRPMSDEIISDHFLIDVTKKTKKPEFLVIKAHAGAGKTVLLQRIAWNASKDYDRLCLFLNKRGTINSAAIKELIELVGERVFLFIDDLADRVKEVATLFQSIGEAGQILTVIGAERINEWNVACDELTPLVTESYELNYLSEKEIDGLLDLLKLHGSLGVLKNASKDQQHAAFIETAGRQLLVALHEATLGKTFEEIIEDEFKKIVPLEAQQVYLTICVLNRYNYPVRAGIISRIHGIPFDDFKRRLFAPLEQVVHVDYNKYLRDYDYKTRHPYIAEMVCERVLQDDELKYDQYIKILKALDIDYSSDRIQYKELVKAKNLLSTFRNPELINNIYEVAYEEIKNDLFLYHQMAIYEMNRPNGNLTRCKELLDKAEKMAPFDKTIQHSKSEYYLKMAEHARTDLEYDKLLSQATAIASKLTNIHNEKPYSYHTIVKSGILRLSHSLKSNQSIGPTLEIIIRDIEKNLREGLQRYPNDPYLKNAESEFAQLLRDSERAINALRIAFKENPRASFIALRLAEIFIDQENYPEAKTILERALNANSNEKKLHYAFAKLLMKHDSPNPDILKYHFRRAFTDGDKNYDAQLLYARQLFIMNELPESKKVFEKLGNAYVDYNIRHSVRYQLSSRFRGEVTKLEATYCWVTREGMNDWIYVHKGNVSDEIWKRINQGCRVIYDIGFSFKGPNGINLEIETY